MSSSPLPPTLLTPGLRCSVISSFPDLSLVPTPCQVWLPANLEAPVSPLSDSRIIRFADSSSLASSLRSHPARAHLVVVHPGSLVSLQRNLTPGLPATHAITALALSPEARSLPAFGDPSLVLPARLRGPHYQPLPPATTSPTVSDDPASLPLSDVSWAALQKTVGLLAWMQVAVPVLAIYRACLSDLLHTGVWSPEAAGSLDALRSLTPMLDRFTFPVDAGRLTVSIFTDASGTGWGAVVSISGHPPLYLSGLFSFSEASGSSTAREACAVVACIRVLFSIGVSFDSVHVVTDSSPLTAVEHGRTKSVAVASALLALAAWCLQGLRITWEWQPRSKGVLQDALASASSPAPWPLIPQVLCSIWRWSPDGWDLDLTAYRGVTSAVALRYATPTTPSVTSEDRLRVLQGIQPSDSFGWAGVTSQASNTDSSLSSFAWPLWSDIPTIWTWWCERRTPLIAVIPATSASIEREWFFPALSSLHASAALTLPLPPAATSPPVPGARADPHPLVAVLLPGSFGTRRRCRPTPPLAPFADPSSHNGSSLGSPADTAWVRGGRCPGDGPQDDELRKAFGQSRPPVPSVSVPNPPPTRQPIPPSTQDDASDLRSAFGRPPRPLRDAWSGSSPPTTAAPPTLPLPALPSPMRLLARSIAEELGAPLRTTAPPTRSIGEWLRAMAAHVASGATVHDTVDPTLQRLLDDTAEAPGAASRRPCKAIEYVATLASDAHLNGISATLPNVQALLSLYVAQRWEKPPPFEWHAVSKASTLAADVSAIAAASTRCGIPLPPFGGPAVRTRLEGMSAFDRPDHSAAYPLPLDVLLTACPPAHAPRTVHMAWEALVVMSFFCLRSGVLPFLHREACVAYASGWLLLWRHSHKRAQAAPHDPHMLSSSPMLAAARHPLLDKIIGRAPTGLLFPGLEHASLTTFVRERVPNAHPSFDIRAYGARVAAVQDAAELGVPAPLARSIFWWRQGEASMTEYYAGANVLRMMLFSEARLHIRHVPLIAGYFAASVASPPPSWVSVLGPAPPLPSPSTAHALALAWDVRSPSFIAKRLKIIGDTRDRAASIASRMYSCCICKVFVGLTDPGYLCDARDCPWGVCASCHPGGSDAELWCPTHAATPPTP